MKRLAPLFAYLPWHARDAVMRALAPVLIALGVIGIPVWAFFGSGDRGEVTDPRGAQMAVSIYQGGIPLVLAIGAIILMNQVVALDREKQHFRFLLAHPVAAWEYYLQRFAVGLVLFVAAIALVPLTFSALVSDVPVIALMKAAALEGLLVGALATLCGVLVNKDGLALIGVFLLSKILQDLDKVDQLASWIEPIARGLPPIALEGEIRQQLLSGTAVASGDLLHVVSYAIGMLAVALFLVKRLPLAR